MPTKNEKRGRGRGKRPRDSSREEVISPDLAPVNYASPPPQSASLSGTTFNRTLPSPDSRVAPPAEDTAAASEGQSSQPINVITSYPPPGKVAIPALWHPTNIESSRSRSKKGRTPHACDYCRKAKAGCSGGNPCTRCKNTHVLCVYGDGKREQDRKMMTQLNEKSISLSQYITETTDALRRIQLDTSLSQEGMRSAIGEVLAITPAPTLPGSQGGSIEHLRRLSSDQADEEGSTEVERDAEAGSTGSVDVINVDIDRDDTRATGHMGKASAVSWAKRTTEEYRRSSQREPTAGRDNSDFAFSSYHVEDADVEFFDTSNVNPYDWPEYDLADNLIRLYFDHVHHAFPILDRADFMATYTSFARGSNVLQPSEVLWLGTLNAIYAISAVYTDLTDSNYHGHADDHLIYCTRARLLCMDQNFLFQDARISTTCFLGLMSLYYVSNCKLNRAWTICGLGIRNAFTLGLHVRNGVDDISDADKEHRVRLWWSLYSLEVFLNELTGRPSCISDRDISTPLPLNINEKDFLLQQPLYGRGDSTDRISSSRQGSKARLFATYQMPIGHSDPPVRSLPAIELPVTSSTYFIYRTQLSIISHEIVTQLYCATSIKEKWSDSQDLMKSIDHRLLTWRESLPKELDIMFDSWSEPDFNDPYTLPRIGLAMSFNSSRMILYRPFLCRLDRSDNPSQPSKGFEQEAVGHCIHSARRMISLLDWNVKTEAKFYAILSWWNTLHYICEALSVLMLEMAFECQHIPKESADILADAKKGIYWLAMLSAKSIAARKAWEIFDNLIRLVAPKINLSVFDLPTTVPLPPRYNWRRFGEPSAPPPGNQLSQENLQIYQESRPMILDSTATWANLDSNQGLGGFSDHHSAYVQFTNQLDSGTAVERFANIGQLHGHYDDPWQQLFAQSAGRPLSSISAPGQSGRQFGPEMEVDMSSTDRYLSHSAFDRNVGGYETLSPTNVQGFQQGSIFETQEELEEEVEMQRRRQSGFGGFQGTRF